MSRIPALGMLLAALAAVVVVSAPNAAAWTPEDARLSACDFGREIGTYDHAALDGYFQRVLDRSTGNFADEFSAAAPALKSSMREMRVRGWVESIECGGIGGDLLRQRVLINLVQVRTNAAGPAPSLEHLTLTATLDNVWGRWLVSELDSAKRF
ncbi:hypothetical protein ACL02S_06010 [Nocardia sp. 004]|uniref:hypothetical protein n=1 Tax=Nocardia sp. 004 TaxID=3385978 RepID=UPI0039A0D485